MRAERLWDIGSQADRSNSDWAVKVRGGYWAGTWDRVVSGISRAGLGRWVVKGEWCGFHSECDVWRRRREETTLHRTLTCRYFVVTVRVTAVGSLAEMIGRWGSGCASHY